MFASIMGIKHLRLDEVGRKATRNDKLGEKAGVDRGELFMNKL